MIPNKLDYITTYSTITTLVFHKHDLRTVGTALTILRKDSRNQKEEH